MNEFWQEVLEFAAETTENVGQQLSQFFGNVQAESKPDGSLVTKADKSADSEIRKAIAAKFPEHGILTEETEHIFPDNDWCWVVDPVDGTTNFTRGIPIWGISLGLLYKGIPVFGFVHLPMINQTFHGYWYGDTGLSGPTGAYLNNQQIHTSPDSPSGNHIFNLCSRSTSVVRQNSEFPCKIRMVGSATYSALLVASGTALGGIEATPKVWDIAAAWVVVKAAGGEFINLEANPVFPLKVGENYGDRPFPSLMVSQSKLIPVFEPLVAFIGEKTMAKYRKSKE